MSHIGVLQNSDTIAAFNILGGILPCSEEHRCDDIGCVGVEAADGARHRRSDVILLLVNLQCKYAHVHEEKKKKDENARMSVRQFT